MKKETRLEMLECALSVIAQDVESNLYKSLLKRKSERIKLLKSIETDLEENRVDAQEMRDNWMAEIKSLKKLKTNGKESSKSIDQRMLILAQVSSNLK